MERPSSGEASQAAFTLGNTSARHLPKSRLRYLSKAGKAGVKSRRAFEAGMVI